MGRWLFGAITGGWPLLLAGTGCNGGNRLNVCDWWESG